MQCLHKFKAQENITCRKKIIYLLGLILLLVPPKLHLQRMARSLKPLPPSPKSKISSGVYIFRNCFTHGLMDVCSLVDPPPRRTHSWIKSSPTRQKGECMLSCTLYYSGIIETKLHCFEENKFVPLSTQVILHKLLPN